MSDLVFLSFSDGKRLFQRDRRLLFKTALFSALLIFILLLFREPQFRAEASFRQTSLKTGKDLKGLFKHLKLGNEESEAIPLMQSYFLLQRVTQELGLQAEVVHSTIFSHAWNNLTRELGGTIEKEGFYFRNLLFSKEKRESFYLLFSDPEHFELLDAKGGRLSQGSIGNEVRTPELVFTLEKTPSQLRFGKKYPLKVTPLRQTAEMLLKSLQIKTSKISPQLVYLKFDYSDRQRAVKILDHLMREYQNFLLHEHQEVAEQQLGYLEKRQNQLTMQLKENWKNYSTFLQNSLKEQGVIGLSKHLELTALPLENEYLKRLSEIALEKKRFEAEEKAVSKTLLTRDFPGLSHFAAQELHEKCSEEYERLRVRIRQLSHLLQEMGDPDFELSSLSGLLTDAISQEMIGKASAHSLILCDESNHSTREIERAKESIQMQRRFLQQHLSETIELERMRLKLLGEKISSLAVSALDFLRNEERVLQRQLKQFREQIASFPERWLLENELKFKKRLSMNVIDVITHLNESKVLQQVLLEVESKPLDFAFASINSKYPFLFLFSFLAAFIGGLGAFLFLLFNKVRRGLPLTFENASVYQVSSAGILSEYVDTSFEQLSLNDLETLRRVAFSLKECSGIILGKERDYSGQIARLLALQGKRVLLVEAIRNNFDKNSQPTEGLSEYLLGHSVSCMIRKEKFYDVLPSGAPTALGAELFSSLRFASLLSELKSQYDAILVASSASPGSSEALALLKTLGSGVVSIKEETYKEIASLLPFSVICIFYE